jgi:hypothetical protein
MTLTLAPRHQAWTGAKTINGTSIAYQTDNDGYRIEIYRAGTGRITIRCSYWHSEQDRSREGYLLDHRVSGIDLDAALARARESGYPRTSLMAAISEAEEAIEEAK